MADADPDPQLVLTEILQDKGFQLGRDFSHTEGGLILGEDAKQAILDDMPAYARPFIERAIRHERQPTPGEALEQHLGVPFFANLQQRMRWRIPQLSAPAAADYLANLVEGVPKRHPELSGWFEDWLVGNLPPQQKQRIARCEDSDEAIAGASEGAWLFDLLLAAGGTEGQHYSEAEAGLSTEGMRLLSQVFEGERCSVREIAAALEQARQQRYRDPR